MPRSYVIGTKRLTSQGYVEIKTAGGWRSEHRIVWEKKYGPIPQGAVIHHQNGDRNDNRLANLVLSPSKRRHAKYHFGMKRSKRPKRYAKTCQGPGCAKEFKTANPHAKYHSLRCRWQAWNARHPRAVA